MSKVRGLEDTLRELKALDKKAATKARARLRNDAKPMVIDGRAAIPSSPPLSKWVLPGHGGVTDIRGRKTVRYQGKSRLPVWNSARAQRGIGLSFAKGGLEGYSGKTLMFSFRQSDAAGITLNSAGRRTDTSLSRNLTRRFGKDQRYMWPVARKHLPTVRASVSKSLRELERDVNRRLKAAR